MRLRLVFLTLLACGAVCAPAQAQLSSPNVSLVTKLPDAVGAISARFSPDGKTMYVSTAKGLHIYDITTPEAPAALSFLPLPHFENEDVDAGNGVVVISNDPSEGVGLIYLIDVKDPRLPTIASVTPNGDILGSSDQSNTGHIANCIQDCKYLWTTGTNEGIAIFDLADLTAPRFVKRVQMPKGFGADGQLKEDPGFTHDVYVDRAGIAWVTGEDGTFGFSTADPENPQLLYKTDEAVFNSGNGGPVSPDTANDYPLDFLHHNSIRTAIQLAGGAVATPAPTTTAPVLPGATPTPATPTPATPTPAPGTTAPTPTTKTPFTKPRPRRPSSQRLRQALKRCGARKACKARARTAQRARIARYKQRLAAWKKQRQTFSVRTTLGGLGDVMAITEEDYTRPGCNGQGSFETWQITGDRNSDGSTKLALLDTWKTELNELETLSGRSPATVNCSAHWFDEDRGLIAQGWYDQGVRFLDITDPKDIRQVGYWVTPGTFWAAYFAPSDPSKQIVYGLDVAGGIDVLRIDRAATATRVAPVPKRWMSGVSFTLGGKANPTFGFACPQLLSVSA